MQQQEHSVLVENSAKAMAEGGFRQKDPTMVTVATKQLDEAGAGAVGSPEENLVGSQEQDQELEEPQVRRSVLYFVCDTLPATRSDNST
ncbi:GD21697 [Drosophila simulans]|uniref:GD21697 n=1 Tax=Drosophila simulans TaxID=7240 RepID=B4Q3E2_DROSI|nr:GD21697 [Drosophila simulans]